MSPDVESLFVANQIAARSVELFGLVKLSIGGAARWMLPSFVVEALTGPSSLMLPTGSWNSEQHPASGTMPSIVYGPATCATAQAGAIRKTIARLTAITVRSDLTPR